MTVGSTTAYVGFTAGTGGLSATQQVLNWTYSTGSGTTPPVPTNVVASAGNGQVGLSWSASSGATSYNVGRSTTSGGPYTTIASPTATSYTDTAVTNGTTYYYVVAAVNSAGTSANSSQVSATPQLAVPPVPTNVVASAGNGQVGLSWSASSGATSYNVGRSTTSGGPYTTIASPTATTYTDTAVTNGTTYYYVVAAVNGAGTSANSSQVSATPQLAVPPVPTNVVASAGNGQVGLSWSASSGATSYNVGRSTTSGGPYTTIASPTATTYTDTAVTNGTTYYYVVAAVNSAGTSANSSQVSATPATITTVINYGGGFTSSGMQLNGNAALNGANLELTNGGAYEASSAYYTTAVNVQSFTTAFSIQLTNANADGMAFVIQNTGLSALGPDGGGLGYGPDSPGGTAGIGKSVAVKFDLYSNQGEGTNSTGLYTDGASPTIPATTLGGGVNLHSGDVLNVQMAYNGTTLTMTMTDASVPADTYTTSWPVNIPSLAGGNTAYVGFTAGTGGLSATQQVLNWTYSTGQ
jgi:fibronectin type 3 domain-containing protein